MRNYVVKVTLGVTRVSRKKKDTKKTQEEEIKERIIWKEREIEKELTQRKEKWKI